jgi:hypothetical protein
LLNFLSLVSLLPTCDLYTKFTKLGFVQITNFVEVTKLAFAQKMLNFFSNLMKLAFAKLASKVLMLT